MDTPANILWLKVQNIASTCTCLEFDIIILKQKIEESTSEEEIKQFKEAIEEIEEDLKDFLLDLAILQEMQKQYQYKEPEEEECYDPRYEILTAEDY